MPRLHRGDVWKGSFAIHADCWEEPHNSVLCDTLEVWESFSVQYNIHPTLEQDWILPRFAVNGTGSEWHLSLISQDHTGNDLAEDSFRSIAGLYHAMESLSALLALCVWHESNGHALTDGLTLMRHRFDILWKQNTVDFRWISHSGQYLWWFGIYLDNGTAPNRLQSLSRTIRFLDSYFSERVSAS